MSDIYRKSSLEKLSNPEQLDKMIKISSPLSWVALAAVFVIIVSCVIWGFAGTLPSTEALSGVIASSDSAAAIYSDTAGTLEKYHKSAGDKVEKGDKIAEITLSDGKTVSINADIEGKLSVLTLPEGSPVLPGTEIARITPGDMSQVLICYAPLLNAGKLEKGMEVLVYPSFADSQEYGHMEAEVLYVEKYAVNTASFSYVLGSGNLLAEQFASSGPVVAVICRLQEDSSSANGFYWSDEKGEALTVGNLSVVSSKIVTEECAPVTKLIGKIKDITEG